MLGAYALIAAALAAYLLALLWGMLTPPAAGGQGLVAASMTEMLLRRQT
jgi:hypothetical protein